MQQVDYQNRKINFGGNWVEIKFSEQEKAIAQIIIIDNQGKYKKVNFSTKSSELLWIDSELYQKATNKSIEAELRNGNKIDDSIDSLLTIPIKNALQNQRRCAYGFYFRNKNVIQYLDSPGKLPSSLGVVKCLPDQVMLRQQVSGNPGFPAEDFFYYVKKDDGSFKIEFSGQPHSQSLAYLINGQLPTVYEEGRLENGCPNCGSGNIEYQPTGQQPTGQTYYIKPRRCQDCDLQFPKYPPNDPDILLNQGEKQELHESLRNWGRGNGLLSNYLDLVIRASENPKIAQQENENIKQSLEQVIKILGSPSGNQKLKELQKIYWLLEAPEKRDARNLLGSQIAYLLNTPTTSTTLNRPLSDQYKQRIDQFLLNWGRDNPNLSEDLREYLSRLNSNLIEFLGFVINPSQNRPVDETRILKKSEQVYEQLESDSQKRNQLVNFYMMLKTTEEQVYVRELLRDPIASLLPIAVLPTDAPSIGDLLLQVSQITSIVEFPEPPISTIVEFPEPPTSTIVEFPEPPTSTIVELNELQKSRINQKLKEWARGEGMNLPENMVLVRYISLVIDSDPDQETTQQEIEEMSSRVIEELINNEAIAGVFDDLAGKSRKRSLFSRHNAIADLVGWVDALETQSLRCPYYFCHRASSV